MKKINAAAIIVLILATIAFSAGKNPAPSILGVKLGIKEEKARKILEKIGKQQKEEKKEEKEEEAGGEEEVWLLSGNKNYNSLIVGFDKNHLVRYVSVFSDKNNSGVRYNDLGDTKSAKFESNPSNYRYTWDVTAKGKNPHYLVIARGVSSDFLSSYSIKGV